MAQVEEGLGVRTLTAETLTAEAFAPFGQILTAEGRERLPIDTYGGGLDVFRAARIESDQPVEFLVQRSRLREFRVLFLERHVQLTQTFVPLDGQAFVFVLAPAGVREENGFPALDEVRAFIVPGGCGVHLARGTWHEAPFPLVDRSVLLATSLQALTAGLGSDFAEGLEVYEKDVEKRNVTEYTGIVLRVQLP
jgi:ureidoglycolate lyase